MNSVQSDLFKKGLLHKGVKWLLKDWIVLFYYDYTGLKRGDYIDIKDSENDWFEAKILSNNSTLVKCHFINYSSKWDCTVALNNIDIAPRNQYSKSTG